MSRAPAPPAFDNSFARLGDGFYAPTKPVPVRGAALVALNDALVKRLGLDADWLSGPEGLAMLAGNAAPPGSDPLAQAYAGHQFGGLSPVLGDGRALLLGEVVAPDGARFDIQLKGSGPTPFSRRGDGRAWLGPVLREYLMSEFMAAAGVPTTRALAMVATGEPVWRETALPGAVLTRVAASHIRVGTFEFFAIRGDYDRLGRLAQHVIARHYPDAGNALGLLDRVVRAQARTIARWMGLGFVHGVMNTDNMAVSGETIDYGPAAYLDAYQPRKVFSSIDRGGRYAYDQQPQIAVWNLAQLGSCLIPLMGDEAKAIRDATDAVHAFPRHYEAAWREVFATKIGLPASDAAVALAQELLDIMAAQGADFTRAFDALAEGDPARAFPEPAAVVDWSARWRGAGPDLARARGVNPRRIPRNHRIQQAIDAGVTGDFGPFHRLLAALSQPFEARPEWDSLARPPAAGQEVTVTYCGT